MPGVALFGVVIVVVGCAHGGAVGDYHRLSDVDARPRLIGCSMYEPPPLGAQRVYQIWVEFDVTPAGDVQNVIVTRASDVARQRGLTDVAQRAAASCRYEPAERDGQNVGVRGLRRLFTFAE